MNPQNSLIPLGPQGQLLDPINFLFFLLTLPIRIVIEVTKAAVNPLALPTPETRALTPRVSFPVLIPSETPLSVNKVIEPVSYTVMPATSPSPTQATYENEERCEIVWNEDGLPTEIIIHRKATRT
jgi:hypothetical protein